MNEPIRQSGKTIVPAYLVLIEKGYNVTREIDSSSRTEYRWIAEKDGVTFSAEDTEPLLGLVTIYEARGDQWNASKQEIGQFLELFGD